MVNNEKQESINIYAKEFKSKLISLIDKNKFPREILFNGSTFEDYNLLTKDEIEAISRKFKKFIEENIYVCATSEIDYILNKSYEDVNTPFSWDDVENIYMSDEYIREYFNVESNFFHFI